PAWTTVFPYTTLFRSGKCARADAGGDDEIVVGVITGIGVHDLVLGVHARRPDTKVQLDVELIELLRGQQRLARLRGTGGQLLLGDRKSTRLNSSHVKI